MQSNGKILQFNFDLRTTAGIANKYDISSKALKNQDLSHSML